MDLVQLRRPHTAQPPDLGDAFRELVLRVDSDVESLRRHIIETRGLSMADADRFIFDVVAELNLRMLPPVTHLEVIHTEGCNLGCSYCFEKDMLGYRRMSRDVAQRAVDFLFAYGGGAPELSIVHFGGEPLMNFDGVCFVTEYAEQRAAAAGKKLAFDMTSNGVLLNEQKAEYLAAHRVMVLLSVDGMRESHDAFRRDKRGRGTFDQVMAGLKVLKRYQQWIGVKMTVMPENAGRLLDDVVGLRECGINQYIIGYATGIEWTEAAMNTYVEQLGQVYQWYQSHRGPDLRIAEFDESAEEAYFGCQAGRSSVTVSVDGEISPCAKVLALDNRRLVSRLGDVHHGVYRLRERLSLVSCSRLKDECDQQGIAEEFRGGCFASNYQATGDVFRPNLQDHRFSLLQRTVCGGCSSQH